MSLFTDFSRRIKFLLKRDWPLFLIMMLLFFGGIWLGTKLPETNPSLAKAIEKSVTNKFGSMKDWLKDMPLFVWILVIWVNNLIASYISFLSGILIIFPAVFVIYQGVILGVVQNLTETGHLSRNQFYLSLLPHGVIELSAIFIISGLGIRFGLTICRSLWRLIRGRDNQELFKTFVAETRDYFILITIMLFIAAIIEVTISPMVLGVKI